MAMATLVTLTLLFNRLAAGSVPSPATDRPCVNFMLPVPATAQNVEYNIAHVNNNIDATAFAVGLDTWSSNAMGRALRYITVSDTFDISVQLCLPPKGIKKQNLLIATHGGGFDKRYWDSAINPSEYSFVDAALAAGYSILTYDRLGTGFSDKPDAYTVVQLPLQVEILRGITKMARSGQLLKHVTGSPNSTGILNSSNASFDKLIHVGHSIGSILTTNFLAAYGKLSDGAVITGYIPNPHLTDNRVTTFGFEYAPQHNLSLFGDRSSGYLVTGTPSTLQTAFFSTRADTTTGIGGFDKEVLDYAFSIRQTSTTSEFLQFQAELRAAPRFRGPLQFVLAEFDFAVCRGDCDVPYDLDTFRKLYPKATDIEIYTQKGTGHALTLHQKANLGYKATLDWLDKNGL